ncbi:MAG TPA: glycosyltransferase, partial [Longimicrobiales bacterium]|nr:glycosyltransferase [Longimicrobiales bacterium]
RRRAGAAEVRLTLVGDGPERGRTRALSRLLGVKGSLELTGRLSREGVRRRLMEAHVFVFPTVRESFGLAALEARAMGLPVLARAGSGVADVVEDGREGFLVASDRALADVLARLARDPGALAEARRRSRESPLPRSLTWAGVLDAYEDVYGRDARR